MKKTILSLLIISLGLTAFAQSRKDDRRDDKRQEEMRNDDRKSPAPAMKAPAPAPKAPAPAVKAPAPKAPAPAVKAPAPKAPVKQVIVQNPAPKHNPKQVVVVQKAPPPKPAPVKFVVKKEKPKKINPWKAFVKAVLAPPPPSRAVVIVNASAPVYEMSQLDRQPQLTETPTINYPENMANAGISGEVTMDVQIDKNGYVGLERVVSSTNEEFAIAAISSLNSFKYEQPLKDGYPVNAKFTISIPFEISE